MFKLIKREVKKMSNLDSNTAESEDTTSVPGLSDEILDKLESIKAQQDSEETIRPDAKSTLYVDKRTQYEDMKSTAYTFLFVGILGVAALIFISLGLVPLSIAGYIKVLLYITMGILFILFIIVGVTSSNEMKKLSKEADEEEKKTSEILEWFLTSILSSEIDESIKNAVSLNEEELYFKRYEFIKQELTVNFSEISSNYQEYMIEKIYSKLFP